MWTRCVCRQDVWGPCLRYGSIPELLSPQKRTPARPLLARVPPAKGTGSGGAALIAGLPIELDENTERSALLDYETSKARLAESRRRPWRIDLRHAGIVRVDETLSDKADFLATGCPAS